MLKRALTVLQYLVTFGALAAFGAWLIQFQRLPEPDLGLRRALLGLMWFATISWVLGLAAIVALRHIEVLQTLSRPYLIFLSVGVSWMVYGTFEWRDQLTDKFAPRYLLSWAQRLDAQCAARGLCPDGDEAAKMAGNTVRLCTADYHRIADGRRFRLLLTCSMRGIRYFDRPLAKADWGSEFERHRREVFETLDRLPPLLN